MIVTLTNTIPFQEIDGMWQMFKDKVHLHIEYVSDIQMVQRYREAQPDDLIEMAFTFVTDTHETELEVMDTCKRFLSDFYDNDYPQNSIHIE